MFRFYAKTKGITIITLVITVIILLILAGITLSTLSGEEGILQKTISAKEQTEISQDIEDLYLKYYEKTLEEAGEEVEIDDYLDYLEEKGISTKKENGKNYAEVEERIYEIKEENGEIKIEYVGKGKIDDPRIQEIEIVEKSKESIKIKVTALRMEEGIYHYYIGEDKDNLGEQKGENEEGEYTFTDLQQGKTYYIKVVGESKSGKTSEKTIEVKMEQVPDATSENIKYEITWKEGVATVKVTTTEVNYKIETSVDNKTYSNIATRTGLNHEDKVYARLTDGKNAGREIEITVLDEKEPEIKLEKVKVTTKSIEIRAEAKDEETGLVESKPYKYYISETVDGYSTKENGANTEGTYTFNELNQNTTYYIKVEREDKAGNKGIKTIEIKTELIPSAREAIERNIEWNSNGTAKITLETKTQYTIEYSTDRTTWEKYTQEITKANGETIYISLTDGKNRGEDYEIKIEDKTGPEVQVRNTSKEADKITVEVEAQDEISGMPETPKYSYYIKKENEEEYQLIASEIEEKTYTYKGLTAENTYNIKVETKDLVGNKGEGKIDVTTREFEYTEGNVEWTNPIWENGTAKVTIKNNTQYNMQYQIIGQGEEIDINGEWETPLEKEKTIEGLNHGEKIIIRIYDGTNASKGYAVCNIIDDKKPQIEKVEGNALEWTNQNVTLKITAKDNESGLDQNPYSFDGGATWQEANTKTYEENTKGIIIQVKDKAGNIENYIEEINIDKIDKKGPIIEIETQTTSNQIEVKVTKVEDEGVGLEETPKYKYYMSTNKQELETMQAEESTNSTKRYTELVQNTTYYIRVEVEDKLGNKTKIDKTITTGSLEVNEDDIEIGEITWEEGRAKTTITNKVNTKYKMEYQIIKEGEEEKLNIKANWIQSEEQETVIENIENKQIIYARLTDGVNAGTTISKLVEDKKAPEMEVEGNALEWTNQNITITVKANDNETGLEQKAYSFDGGATWQEENTKTYNQNTKGIIIKVRDKAGNIAENEPIDIDKIDKNGPIITLEEKETTTNKTTIEIIGKKDEGVGLKENPTYIYYIKEKNEEEYKKEGEESSTSHTFENLKSNTQYTIKVETTDKLENIGSQTIEINTKNLLLNSGDIKFIETIWNNSKATVTVTNSNTEYDMQYQIAKNEGKIDLNGKWTTVKEKEIKINNLENKDIIYVRLTDGYNVTEGYATCNIDNVAKEIYTEEELAKETTRAEYEILGISVASNEIKVQIEEEQENATAYNYYYKTINEDEYKLISTNTYHNEPAVITDIQKGATYKIKVLVTDNKGNVTRSENTATTIAEEEAQENTEYTNNRTYIDKSRDLEIRTNNVGTENVQTETVQAGYTISVPETFKISNVEGEKKQEEGVILKDQEENEYVWIPVNDAIYDEITQIPTSTAHTSTYKPMAKEQSENKEYYEGLIYSYSKGLSYRNTNSSYTVGKAGYREPSLITGNAEDGYTWNILNLLGVQYDAGEENYKNILGFETPTEFGKYLASSYNNMITSVDSYGGFYVGRYETTMEEVEGNIKIGSKPNSKILSTNNWYKMYLYQDSQKYETNPYSKVKSVTSNMIWGSQWDAMLNYVLKGKDAEKITSKIAEQKNVQNNSKSDENDKINNIYDLTSNAFEWTQEANNTNGRVYRGGSYDKSTSGTAITRAQVVPTDQGPVFGSRVALYMQSVNDVTGPAVKINSITSTSNSITVNVSATDKETGVEKYNYAISENGETWGTEIESTATTYKFEGLKQKTRYYIKITAVDGAGNIGAEKIEEKETTELGNIAKNSITRTQKYGANGSGIVKLQITEEYANTGYYIEYQVVEENQNIEINGEWTKGDVITGLSNGQKIYAKISDGTNRTEDNYEETVSGLEEYEYYTKGDKTTESETLEYTDTQGNTAYIPAGFKVGTTDTVKNIQDGLVIQDQAGNEYVWIPVENAVYDESKGTLPTTSSDTSTYKPMARYQTGYDKNSPKKYYEGILYTFANTFKTGSYARSKTNTLGTAGYREPTLVTANADYTWDVAKGTAKGAGYDIQEIYYKNLGFGANSGVEVFDSYTEFGQYMNKEYANMVESVEKYGGFYVGRYETSLEGTAGNKDAIAQSKIAKTPINNQNWYKDYYYQDSKINAKNPYYNSKSVTSSMIWGSQWDAIMNWMLEDEKTKEYITEIRGNHTDAVAITGSYSDDLAKNIFDLSSNVAEYTQQGESNYRRFVRGGTAGNINSIRGRYTASSYNDYWSPPTTTTIPYTRNSLNQDVSGNFLGTRMVLYINKGTDDNTEPTIEIESTEKGTNNIKVKVNAIDNESGIEKYKFYINDTNNFDTVISEIETYSNTNVFEGLNQNQTYYIKVEAINGVGLTKSIQTEGIRTDVLKVEEGAIVKEKVYGKNGQGIAYFTISDETDLEKQGYYLQYQIVKQGGVYQPNGNWTKGDTVTGLSVGDIVYTRLYDGVNISEYYMATNITELEEYSEIYEQTTKYEDYETVVKEDGTQEKKLVGTAYIPAGFRVGTADINSRIKNGLVIEDEKGNQYVWIPVENAVYDEKTTLAQSGNSSTYKPMARYQEGYNSNTENQYYEGILYNYSGTRSYVMSTANKLGTIGQREPSLVTGSTANYSWVYNAGADYDAANYAALSPLGITSTSDMGIYINNQYTKVVESIAKYGGFYVGRYETSKTAQNEVQSKKDQEVMASINWYNMYLYQDSKYTENPYKESTSVESSMIWGSQYDAMLNYILEGTDKGKVTIVTGNHTGTRGKTGIYGNDIMNNIFDISSNVREWTQEANSSYRRVGRGGDYGTTDNTTASYRCDYYPTGIGSGIGSRLTLYLK